MQNSKNHTKYIGWLGVSIFFFYQYILRKIPGTIQAELVSQFDVNDAIWGQISGAFYIGYGLGLIPMGFLMDRFGTKKVVSLSIILNIIGQLPFNFSHNWHMALIGQILTGLSACGAIVGVFKTVNDNFNKKHFGRIVSFSVAIGLVGAIYGGAPLRYLTNEFGHKIILKAMLIFGIFLAFINYIFLSDSKGISSNYSFLKIRKILNFRILLGGICMGLLQGTPEGFITVWSPLFLQKNYNLSSIESNSLPGIFYVTYFLSGPILTYIAEKIGHYYRIISFYGVIIMIIMTCIILGIFTKTTLFLAFVILGMCGTYEILVIHEITRPISSENTATISSLVNSINMSFGYIFNSLIGSIITIFGGNNSLFALKCGIGIIPIFALLGSIGFYIFSLSPNNKKSPL